MLDIHISEEVYKLLLTLVYRIIYGKYDSRMSVVLFTMRNRPLKLGYVGII